MTQPDIGPERGLYGMMQCLMVLAAHQEIPEAGPARGVVTREDARDVVLLLAAVIDEATQAGRVPPERGIHAGAMLMLLRDYVQPLPAVPGDDGADQVTPDLKEILRELRRLGGETGIQG